MFSVPLTMGVEEEYQIINRMHRGLTAQISHLMKEGEPLLGDQIKKEFLQSQVEIGTNICQNPAEVRTELVRLRRSVSEIAQKSGRVIVAASTHPFSKWSDQKINPGERYEQLLDQMQELGRQMVIFGMHVHIGFGTDSDSRELLIQIQNQIRYFVPYILALTTSSPFFDGHSTGLKSYRSILFGSMPRTGIPPAFNSYSEFEQLINDFGRAGTFGEPDEHGKYDYTKIWWDIRPHAKFGTLEVRVSDICTTLDEAVSIAALIQALCAKLLKLREQNLGWLVYPDAYIRENKWRAVRFGLDGELIDWGKKEAMPMRDIAKQMLEFVDDMVDDLGSRQEVEYIETIIKNGTSADRQLRVYEQALANGDSNQDALQKVVDHLIGETHQGWR